MSFWNIIFVKHIYKIIDLVKYITIVTLFLLRPGTTQYLD